jgi:hypothetical protein
VGRRIVSQMKTIENNMFSAMSMNSVTCFR